ncbi:NYN domain-containing protein [Jannaschia sp. KMU-145]|uniref:NYN domain-containing protein n=1 Tax=Jannaschia halovivens TaxID=3388667 RepID=UPI00396B1BA2
MTLSILGIAAALMLPGWSDLLLLAGPCGLAALFLLLRAARKGSVADTRPPIILDGSNVMHWKGGIPDIETVRDVLRTLDARGYGPGVVFGANVGDKLFDRYRHDGALAKMLGLLENRVMVVPKGEPADPVILRAARDMGAPIVTNDRFRDWHADYPEAAQPGHLIRGGYRDGALWLALPKDADA